MSKYVFWILIDDASGEQFFELFKEEPCCMPTIKEFIYKRGSYTKRALTGFPSSSVEMHTSLITGALPRNTHIPHAWWWDVTNKKPKRIDLSDIGRKTLSLWNSKKILHAKSCFEYIRDSASFHAIYRGAKLAFLKFWKIVWWVIWLKLTRQWDIEDREGFWEKILIDNLVKYLKRIKKKGLPQLSFITYPPSDTSAHFHGFKSDDYKKSLILIDRVLKILIEGTTDKKGNRVEGLKDLGYYDDSLFVICSDHSSREFPKGEFDILGKMQKELNLNILGIPKEEGKKEDPNTAEILAAPGARAFIFYVRDPKTKKFTKRLGNLLMNYPSNSKGSINLIEWFLDNPEIVRIYYTENENTIRVYSKSGNGVIERKKEGKSSSYRYKVEFGIDPLNYSGIVPIADGNWHTEDEWHKNTYNHQIPGIIFNIFGLFDYKNGGNLVLIPQDDYNFLAQLEVEEGHKKVQNHDGDTFEEVVVPMLFAGPGIKNNYKFETCRNIDCLPTVLKWLDIRWTGSTIEGKPIDDIFEK
ncbi:MAG: alkaline phosphatase family protein [Candidatus Helarchaeota archaeon]